MQNRRMTALLGMVLAVLMMGVSSVAVAQGPGGGGFGGGRGGRGGMGAMFGDPAAFFDQLDTNKDGKVTQDEFTQSMTTMMGNRGQRGQAGQGGPGGMGGNFDPAQMRQQMQERMLQNYKEQLGATDEEWTVLQARIQKVMDAQESLRQFEGRGMMGGRGGRGGMAGMGGRGGRGGFGGAQADEPKEIAALNTALENTGSSEAQIAQALKDYRAARDTAQANLKTAQDDLKKVVTVKQEAILVTMGMLE